MRDCEAQNKAIEAAEDDATFWRDEYLKLTDEFEASSRQSNEYFRKHKLLLEMTSEISQALSDVPGWTLLHRRVTDIIKATLIACNKEE